MTSSVDSINPAPAIRTHNIEQIIHAPIGETARLCGWVQHRRDLGQLIFITLRDRWGELQFNYMSLVKGLME